MMSKVASGAEFSRTPGSIRRAREVLRRLTFIPSAIWATVILIGFVVGLPARYQDARDIPNAAHGCLGFSPWLSAGALAGAQAADPSGLRRNACWMSPAGRRVVAICLMRAAPPQGRQLSYES
jgi:hypothetical protein